MVYKLIMQTNIATPPMSWVLTIPTWEDGRLIEPQAMNTVLAAIQQLNHCATRFYMYQDTMQGFIDGDISLILTFFFRK